MVSVYQHYGRSHSGVADAYAYKSIIVCKDGYKYTFGGGNTTTETGAGAGGA